MASCCSPRLLAAVLLTLAAACGGSSQEAKTYPPGPFAIGGTVSGLIGTGLSLGVAGTLDIVSPSADGRFAFSGAYAGGTAWSVVVLTQPTSPSETCVVTHGSGTIGADVTDVQVTCTGNPQLLSGYYDLLHLANRTDACGLLQPDAAMAVNRLPVTLDALAPGSLEMLTGVVSTMPYTSGLSGGVTGTSFSVTESNTFDFNTPSIPVPATDCVVRVDVTMSGTITGLGLAHATLTSSAVALSGTQCDQTAQHLSMLSASQVQFPCSAHEELDLSFATPFAPRPTTTLDFASMNGAHLRDQTSTVPADGFGQFVGSFGGTFVDAQGVSACFAPGQFVNAYVAVMAAGDLQVQISADALTWSGNQPFSVGGDNQLVFLDTVSGASFSAVSADVSFLTSPMNIGDGLDCQIQVANVVF